MSFEIVCSGCGAMSGPSVGVCPFCKTLMKSVGGEGSAGASIQKVYEEGKLDTALDLAKKMYAEEKSKKDPRFLILFAKILIDTEGPSSMIRSVLAEAHLLDPQNPEVLDYMEMMEAKYNLKKGLNDAAEVQLKKLLRRTPKNYHLLFILGSHIFWIDGAPAAAVHYLEECVRLSPNYLRAWGCLGAIYKKLGNEPMAARAFQKCIQLENDPKMKEFFQSQL